MKNVTLKTLISLALLSSGASYSQFKRFESSSNFNPKQNEEASEALSQFAGATEGDDESNQETFGSRTSAPTFSGKENTSKYVNLNPETAFGPEIVTSFEFQDTDILELTKHMQKLTGINLILDKDVKGKISISAPTAITVGDAWKAYLAALNMAGYTLVKSGAFYKVINARDVRYTPTKIYTSGYTPDTEAHIMKVIALKNVDAAEIARNFRPFMSRYGRIIEIKQTNTLIVSDTGVNVNRLEKMLKFVDVPGHEDSLHIIPVHNSSAQEIAKLLDSILKGGANANRPIPGRPATPALSSSQSSDNISKIIAEPRTNSIIAMANADGARQLKDLISKLDVKLVSSSSGKIHVHYLNYGNAEELAKTLSNLISGAKTQDSGSQSPGNRFIPRGSGEDTSIFNSEVKVTADKDNNALVVTASPTDWLTLKGVISKLDIPRDQVYVEGLILETTIRKVRGFGIDYMGAYGSGGAQMAGISSKAGGGSIIDLLSTGPQSLNGFFAGFGAGGSHEFQVGDKGPKIKVNSVNGLVKAIATNSNSNVLATPQILAMDNTEAEFQVGATVPVQKTTTSNTVTTTSTENQEAKLSLKITPQINKVTRFVKLKINQTINDFIGDASTAPSQGLATTTRAAVTEVMVKDKDTIAMGGLLRDKDDVAISKVPLLGDIPVLGWLFKSKNRTTEKVNLLMFLTPTILSPYDSKASASTLSKLDQRESYLNEVLDKDEKDVFNKKVQDLKSKVKDQSTKNTTEDSYGELNPSDVFYKVNN